MAVTVLDNRVLSHEWTTGDGTVAEVTLDKPIDGLWTNDSVMWLNAEWRVWKIDGATLTLLRKE